MLESPVGNAGCDLLHGVQTEIATMSKNGSEQRTHLSGVDPLLAGPKEVGTESEVVLDLDEQIGQPDRAAARVEPAMQLGEVFRAGRVGNLARVGFEPSPRCRRRRPADCQGCPPGTGRPRPIDEPSIDRLPSRDWKAIRYAPRRLRGSAPTPSSAGRTPRTGRSSSPLLWRGFRLGSRRAP